MNIAVIDANIAGFGASGRRGGVGSDHGGFQGGSNRLFRPTR